MWSVLWRETLHALSFLTLPLIAFAGVLAVNEYDYAIHRPLYVMNHDLVTGWDIGDIRKFASEALTAGTHCGGEWYSERWRPSDWPHPKKVRLSGLELRQAKTHLLAIEEMQNDLASRVERLRRPLLMMWECCKKVRRSAEQLVDADTVIQRLRSRGMHELAERLTANPALLNEVVSREYERSSSCEVFDDASRELVSEGWISNKVSDAASHVLAFDTASLKRLISENKGSIVAELEERRAPVPLARIALWVLVVVLSGLAVWHIVRVFRSSRSTSLFFPTRFGFMIIPRGWGTGASVASVFLLACVLVHVRDLNEAREMAPFLLSIFAAGYLTPLVTLFLDRRGWRAIIVRNNRVLGKHGGLVESAQLDATSSIHNLYSPSSFRKIGKIRILELAIHTSAGRLRLFKISENQQAALDQTAADMADYVKTMTPLGSRNMDP